MATGKVRIFELAKEVGLTSKELITLFNERLKVDFEAKTQLSVVPDQYADQIRKVFAKPAAAKAAPAKPAAPKRAAKPAAAPAQAKVETPAEPIPTLKPVTGVRRPAIRPVAPRTGDGAARPAPPPTTTASASPAPRVPQPGRLIQPAPQRRPQGNGPFRPLTPPRPFRPGIGPVTEGPAPS